MDEKEYWQREYQITMLAAVGQHSDRVKVLAAESLFTLYQFRYAIEIKDQTLPIFEYLKCFKN
jgi:uncharacterized protein (DUF4213/DUF364 family)